MVHSHMCSQEALGDVHQCARLTLDCVQLHSCSFSFHLSQAQAQRDAIPEMVTRLMRASRALEAPRSDVSSLPSVVFPAASLLDESTPSVEVVRLYLLHASTVSALLRVAPPPLESVRLLSALLRAFEATNRNDLRNSLRFTMNHFKRLPAYATIWNANCRPRKKNAREEIQEVVNSAPATRTRFVPVVYIDDSQTPELGLRSSAHVTSSMDVLLNSPPSAEGAAHLDTLLGTFVATGRADLVARMRSQLKVEARTHLYAPVFAKADHALHKAALQRMRIAFEAQSTPGKSAAIAPLKAIGVSIFESRRNATEVHRILRLHQKTIITGFRSEVPTAITEALLVQILAPCRAQADHTLVMPLLTSMCRTSPTSYRTVLAAECAQDTFLARRLRKLMEEASL
jgi:hypothetical protein